MKVSEDATCGNDVTCIGSGFGDCCSSSGWCGSSKDYCGSGCQSLFGSCDGIASSLASATVSGSTRFSLGPTSSSSQAALSSSASSATAFSSGFASTGNSAASNGVPQTSTEVPSTSTGTSTFYSVDPSGTSSSGSTSALPTPTSGTVSAAPSASSAGVRVYEERDGQWVSPACTYLVADKRVTNIIKEPKSAAIAECQGRCNAYPGCRTFFLYEENDRVGGPGFDKMYCAYGVRPWNDDWLQCNNARYQFSIGFEYVRTDGGAISASGPGGSSASSTSSSISSFSSISSSSSSSLTTSSSSRTTASTTSTSSTTSSASRTTSSSSSTTGTTTAPAAPSTSVRSVRVYERRSYKSKSPGCASIDKTALTIRGLDSTPGPNKDYATGVAQCQGMCDAYAGCETFFYSRQDGTLKENSLAQCTLDKRAWSDGRIQCGWTSIVFSAGYQFVRTNTVTVTLGATSSGPTSTEAPR